jgi:TonB family protein
MANEVLDILLRLACASSLAAFVALLLRGPLRERFGAHVAYLIWMLMPVSMAVALLPAPTMVAPSDSMPLPLAPFGAMLVAAQNATSSPIDFNACALIAWLAGAAICTFALLMQQRRFVLRLGKLVDAGERVWRARSASSCPALVGAWRPRIVVPADFESRYTDTERTLILAHERMHVARGDAQVNLFVVVLRCLFWFNPLLHFAASRFRFDQELACDAAVIARFPEARRSYADAMLKTQLADFGLPVGCHWQSSHPLKERIFMLKKTLPSRLRRAVGMTLAVVLVAAGAAAGWAAQPKNSVSAEAQVTAVPAAAAADPGRHGATYRSINRISYPAAQAASGAAGTVFVVAHIGADGKVVSASIQKTSGAPADVAAFSRVALDSVQNWTFNPARRNGEAVPSDAIVPVIFSDTDAISDKLPDNALNAILVRTMNYQARETGDKAPSENVEFRRMDPPRYPPQAIAAKQSGKIVLKVLVDNEGVPQSAEVFKSEPPEAEQIFAGSSIAAAMQWMFTPGLHDGKPQGGYVLVPFTYTLTDD